MRRPSGVTHPNWSRKVVKVVLCVDLVKSSAVLLHSQSVIVDGHFADGVVASVFEPFERGMDDWGRVRALVKNATEYPAQTPSTLGETNHMIWQGIKNCCTTNVRNALSRRNVSRKMPYAPPGLLIRKTQSDSQSRLVEILPLLTVYLLWIARRKSFSIPISRNPSPTLCLPNNNTRISGRPRGHEQRMNLWATILGYWLDLNLWSLILA